MLGLMLDISILPGLSSGVLLPHALTSDVGALW